MFLALHLSWLALQFSWCKCKCNIDLCRHLAFLASLVSTQIYVYPIPLETLLWGLWGFPLSQNMFANERTTWSIIIYRIFCLFIATFFPEGECRLRSSQILYNL